MCVCVYEFFFKSKLMQRHNNVLFIEHLLRAWKIMSVLNRYLTAYILEIGTIIILILQVRNINAKSA